LERICLKMMGKSPADRYPTMKDVVEALEEAIPREAPAVVQPTAWDKLRGAAKRLFSLKGRTESPASPAPQPSPSPARQPPAEVKKPAPEFAPTQMTNASGSDVKPIDEMDATKQTTEY
jgi:hypothetical protein